MLVSLLFDGKYSGSLGLTITKKWEHKNWGRSRIGAETKTMIRTKDGINQGKGTKQDIVSTPLTELNIKNNKSDENVYKPVWPVVQR